MGFGNLSGCCRLEVGSVLVFMLALRIKFAKPPVRLIRSLPSKSPIVIAAVVAAVGCAILGVFAIIPTHAPRVEPGPRLN